MKSGYDAFFKKAQQSAKAGVPGGPPKSNDLKMVQDKVNQIRAEKRRKRNKAQSPFPFSSVIFSGILALVLGWMSFSKWDIDQLWSRIQVKAFTLAGAADVGNAEKSAETKEKGKEKPAAGETKDKQDERVGTKSWNGEEANHFNKLNDRKKELDLREKELSELEEELHRQRDEIEARIVQLEKVRSQIGQVLKERVIADDEKVGKLVDFYSNMKAKQAAEVLENMNEDLAVEILGRMKKKSAADIMNLMKSDKAKVLTEKYAGYKRP